MSRLPPYANGARIVAGQLWIRYGRAGWQFLKDHPECGELVNPGDQDPARFIWGARGLDVQIVANTRDDKTGIFALVDALYDQGAHSVRVNWQLNSVLEGFGNSMSVEYGRDHGCRG